MVSVLLTQMGGLIEGAKRAGAVSQVRDLMLTVEAMAHAVRRLLEDGKTPIATKAAKKAKKPTH